ncbi:MAG: hypothetical protein K2X81_14745 [Candidatus Obscuribacterales bacterium]|nr:hypothetical protein [Candidatus Obscuribacterales bacterium]
MSENTRDAHEKTAKSDLAESLRTSTILFEDCLHGKAVNLPNHVCADSILSSAGRAVKVGNEFAIHENGVPLPRIPNNMETPKKYDKQEK